MLRLKYLVKLVTVTEEWEGPYLLGSRVTTTTSACHDFLHQSGVDSIPNDGFHHRQVFKVVMCLEQGISGEEFHQDTSNTPDITWETPAQV